MLVHHPRQLQRRRDALPSASSPLLERCSLSCPSTTTIQLTALSKGSRSVSWPTFAVALVCSPCMDPRPLTPVSDLSRYGGVGVALLSKRDTWGRDAGQVPARDTPHQSLCHLVRLSKASHVDYSSTFWPCTFSSSPAVEILEQRSPPPPPPNVYRTIGSTTISPWLRILHSIRGFISPVLSPISPSR